MRGPIRRSRWDICAVVVAGRERTACPVLTVLLLLLLLGLPVWRELTCQSLPLGRMPFGRMRQLLSLLLSLWLLLSLQLMLLWLEKRRDNNTRPIGQTRGFVSIVADPVAVVLLLLLPRSTWCTLLFLVRLRSHLLSVEIVSRS